jgi:hypothetical protein
MTEASQPNEPNFNGPMADVTNWFPSMSAFSHIPSQTRQSLFGQTSPFADPQYYEAMERHLAPIFRALADTPRHALTDLRVQVIESSGSAELVLNVAHKRLNLISLR